MAWSGAQLACITTAGSGSDILGGQASGASDFAGAAPSAPGGWGLGRVSALGQQAGQLTQAASTRVGQTGRTAYRWAVTSKQPPGTPQDTLLLR